MKHFRTRRIVYTGVGLFALYVLGLFVRGEYGIEIIVGNASDKPLRNVRAIVESRGKSYDLGDIAPNKQLRVFLSPVTESNINLDYVDDRGARHVDTVVGYVEKGYCGKAEVTILPGNKTVSNEKIDLLACWRSWLDFI